MVYSLKVIFIAQSNYSLGDKGVEDSLVPVYNRCSAVETKKFASLLNEKTQ